MKKLQNVFFEKEMVLFKKINEVRDYLVEYGFIPGNTPGILTIPDNRLGLSGTVYLDRYTVEIYRGGANGSSFSAITAERNTEEIAQQIISTVLRAVEECGYIRFL